MCVAASVTSLELESFLVLSEALMLSRITLDNAYREHRVWRRLCERDCVVTDPVQARAWNVKEIPDDPSKGISNKKGVCILTPDLDGTGEVMVSMMVHVVSRCARTLNLACYLIYKIGMITSMVC